MVAVPEGPWTKIGAAAAVVSLLLAAYLGFSSSRSSSGSVSSSDKSGSAGQRHGSRPSPRSSVSPSPAAPASTSPPTPASSVATALRGATTIAAAPILVPGHKYSVNLLTAVTAPLVPPGDGPQDGGVCPMWAGEWWKLKLRAGENVSVNWSYSSPASGFYQFLVFSPSTTDRNVLNRANQNDQVQFVNSDSSPASGSFTVQATGTYPFIIGDGCPSTSGPFQFVVQVHQ